MNYANCDLVDPCVDELFFSVFHSSEAGIAKQFLASNDEKLFHYLIWSIEQIPQKYYFIESVTYRFERDLLKTYIVASELKDPICHSNECQIGSFSSEATIYAALAVQGIIIMYLNQLNPLCTTWYKPITNIINP